MHVILLTVFVSLVLVGFFLALFVGERSGKGSISSAERDSLLPLQDDEAVRVRRAEARKARKGLKSR